ncbi:MAG: serine/threonine protein kinase [Actinobacteria bacterium]|nr:MAG: serine/threonine protein kinase [Actinomycetota bacterium]
MGTSITVGPSGYRSKVPATPSSPVTERYRLVRPLGAGGMGRVWLGYDEVLRRDVAVKEVVPPPGLTAAEQDQSATRSLREARAIARLNHPNVVRIYDVVNKEPWPWIVMEYVPSRSLHQVIAEDGPQPPAEVARIGLGVLAALCAAHRAGVVHRDVKPSNVLLSDHRVVLTDWGLATMEGDATVTRSGMIIGSPAYIAPERARDGASGPAADLWSLGATLYAAVEGHAPFERTSAIATLTALATEDLDPPKHAGPLRPALVGLLRKDPAARSTPQEAQRLLRKARGKTKPPPVLPWRAPRPRPAEAIPVSPAPPEEPPTEVRAAELTPPVVPDTEVTPPVVPAAEVTPPVPTDDQPTAVQAPVTHDRRAAVLTVVGLLLVVLLAVGIGLIVANRHAPTTPSAPATAGAATLPSSATGPSTGSSVPPSSAPTSVAAAPPPAQNGAPTLPAGWHFYHDPTGFTVAVPDGWTTFRRDGIVYFREPDGRRLLGIDQTNQPKMDPVADWRAQESYRVAHGDFPGYEPLGIRHVDYHVTAADWEFRYDDHGVRTHVLNRGAVFNDHQAYGFYWSTPEDQWAANVDNFHLITDTFQGKP